MHNHTKNHPQICIYLFIYFIFQFVKNKTKDQTTLKYNKNIATKKNVEPSTIPVKFKISGKKLGF